MAGAAELGALAVEDLAGLGLVDGELEVVDLARHDVALEQEARDVPGVDDVAALEGHVDLLADRDGHAAALAGAAGSAVTSGCRPRRGTRTATGTGPRRDVDSGLPGRR